MQNNHHIVQPLPDEGRVENRREISLAGLGLFLFALLLSLFVLIGMKLFHFEAERHKQQEIEKVKQQLDLLATALKSRIYANIYAVSGVKSLVAMNPDLTQEDFNRAMAIQFREQHDLRNIGLARDMVLQLTLTGNSGHLMRVTV